MWRNSFVYGIRLQTFVAHKEHILRAMEIRKERSSKRCVAEELRDRFIHLITHVNAMIKSDLYVGAVRAHRILQLRKNPLKRRFDASDKRHASYVAVCVFGFYVYALQSEAPPTGLLAGTAQIFREDLRRLVN